MNKNVIKVPQYKVHSRFRQTFDKRLENVCQTFMSQTVYNRESSQTSVKRLFSNVFKCIYGVKRLENV